MIVVVHPPSKKNKLKKFCTIFCKINFYYYFVVYFVDLQMSVCLLATGIVGIVATVWPANDGGWWWDSFVTSVAQPRQGKAQPRSWYPENQQYMTTLVAFLWHTTKRVSSQLLLHFLFALFFNKKEIVLFCSRFIYKTFIQTYIHIR